MVRAEEVLHLAVMCGSAQALPLLKKPLKTPVVKWATEFRERKKNRSAETVWIKGRRVDNFFFQKKAWKSISLVTLEQRWSEQYLDWNHVQFLNSRRPTVQKSGGPWSCVASVLFFSSLFLFSCQLCCQSYFLPARGPRSAHKRHCFRVPLAESQESIWCTGPRSQCTTQTTSHSSPPAAQHSHPLRISKTPSVAEWGHLLVGGWLGANSAIAS